MYKDRASYDLTPPCTACFPGTEQIWANPSPFAGISMIFLVIPGNPSEMKFLYQEKEFVVERVSGNEQLGSNSWEARVESTWITAAQALLRWCTAASALGHLHLPRVETRRRMTSAHFQTRALQQTPFFGTNFHFQRDYRGNCQNSEKIVAIPEITDKIVEIPAKRLGRKFV